MGHQAAVEAIVRASFEQLDLAAATLLSGSSQETAESSSAYTALLESRLHDHLHDGALDTSLLERLLDTNGGCDADGGD